jgi:hypothetical protein
VVQAIGEWGATWSFTEPRAEELDPDLLIVWMARHVDRRRLPPNRIVVKFDFPRPQAAVTGWSSSPRRSRSASSIPASTSTSRSASTPPRSTRVYLGQAELGGAIRAGQLKMSGPRALQRGFRPVVHLERLRPGQPLVAEAPNRRIAHCSPASRSDRRVSDNEQFWRAIVTGDEGVMRRERRRTSAHPGAPRCKTCLVPLGGPAAPMVRLVLKRRPSSNEPELLRRVRDVRADASRRRRGRDLDAVRRRARVDGRSRSRCRPTEFSRLMNRFFDCANRVVIDSDGLVDKLVGDEVVALYVPAVGS